MSTSGPVRTPDSGGDAPLTLAEPLPPLSGGGATSFWTAADIVIALPISWVPLAADYTRHVRSGRAAFTGAAVGYGLATVVMFALGVLALAAHGSGGAGRRRRASGRAAGRARRAGSARGGTGRGVRQPLLHGRLRAGGTAREPERARQLVAEGADYLGVGPAWPTTTKTGLPAALGPAGIRAVAAAADVPVVAIGGITAERVPELLAAGAAGVAVVGAVAAAADPGVATRQLVRTLAGACGGDR